MIVSTDIPHHVSLSGSRERLTLYQCSADSSRHWSVNQMNKGILAKDCRDGGGCMNNLNWMNVRRRRKDKEIKEGR